jgi:nicotinamide-nucleotide amidase
MNVELLTLGHELLDGRRVDTNTAWIGKFLTGLGLQIRFKQTTLDRKEDIVAAFQLAVSRSDLILCTGGLGPTQDDITFECLAEAIAVPLEYHPDIFEGIKTKYFNRGIPCPESNRRQASIPKGCTPINNERGTAPGCFIEIKNKMIFCFPGVPNEMQLMMENFFVQELQKKKIFEPGFQLGYSISGVAEARVEEKIQALGLDKRNDCTLHVAYTASSPMVDVTFSIIPNVKGDQDRIFSEINRIFVGAFSDFLTRWDGKSVEEHIVDALQKQKQTLGIAESITGGMVTSSIVDVPGCSNVLMEGRVTYSNESKIKLLDVSLETLKNQGAVSAESALEMAKGMRKNAGVDFALATTGIAGPSGATEKKQVGLVYFCWVGPSLEKDPHVAEKIKYVESTHFVGPTTKKEGMNKEQGFLEQKIFSDETCFAIVQAFQFRGDRKRNRMLATHRALIGLHTLIMDWQNHSR